MKQGMLKKRIIIMILIIAMLVPYVPVFTIEVKAAAPTIGTVGGIVEYGYKGYIQEFEATVDGIYQLEVWGAQGGYDKSSGTYYYGGLGGYSKGNVKLKRGEKLYIAVGGKGADCDYNISKWALDSNGNYLAPDITRPNGGWNGGGGPYFQRTANQYDDPDDPDDDGYVAWNIYEGGGGGGATSIQTSIIGDGQLKNYESNKSNVLIVAGGGGGGSTSPGSQEEDGFYSSSVSGAPGGGLERRRIYFYA